MAAARKNKTTKRRGLPPIVGARKTTGEKKQRAGEKGGERKEGGFFLAKGWIADREKEPVHALLHSTCVTWVDRLTRQGDFCVALKRLARLQPTIRQYSVRDTPDGVSARARRGRPGGMGRNLANSRGAAHRTALRASAFIPRIRIYRDPSFSPLFPLDALSPPARVFLDNGNRGYEPWSNIRSRGGTF
ncbi:hypothetical protein KM043_008467 [Ampulex compressa]|nr:hypothetical protein KM043_008467 [Ampulex compressa]